MIGTADAANVGFMVVGALLIAITLGNSFIARLPLSASMLYLLVGVGLGPVGWALVVLDPFELDTVLIERLTEIAVLISLFTAGLKLDLPLRHPRWRLPLRLATLSMVVTVALVAALGHWLLSLPLGGAVLLAAILAPTDPVLASDVQVSGEGDRDRLRFGLTGEGGLNDGTAFPFVMLGLGLLNLHDLGAWGWRWLAVDVVWAAAAGLAIGYALGALVGRAILVLRTRHREALGSDEFVALGLVALAYGVALWCNAYGFLAVFAAGLALRRLEPVDAPSPVATAAADTPGPAASSAEQAAGKSTDGAGKGHAGNAGTHPASAAAAAARSLPSSGEGGGGDGPPMDPQQQPEQLMRAVAQFNVALEHVAEVAVVLMVGALLAWVQWDWRMAWFVPVLFLLVRPLAVFAGMAGSPVARSQRRLMAWFGIRGIGSIYYLAYAINHGLDADLARQLLSITLTVVVASIVVHGVSVTPLMQRYEARRKGAGAGKGVQS